MNEMHIFASTPKKDAYKGMAKHDHPCTAPDNLVNQNFRIAPRKIICTDITYLYFGILRTTIYLCVFRDAYTKEILGWALKNLMTTALIKEAYDKMMDKHGKELHNPSVVIHSDYTDKKITPKCSAKCLCTAITEKSSRCNFFVFSFSLAPNMLWDP